ncbi:hypothetical protein AGMMS50267_06650 [Spirochaetia bacterium]|nr:hypothetical protein AGMMS50267_06650 [Spirochaetia bacterium]
MGGGFQQINPVLVCGDSDAAVKAFCAVDKKSGMKPVYQNKKHLDYEHTQIRK